MDKPCEVKWTKTARDDLLQVVHHLKQQSPQAAASVYDHIKEKALELDQFTERGRIVPELQSQGVFHYRELIVANHWRVIYKIVGCTVFVLAVLDARRNLEDILLQRLLGLKSC